MTREWGCFFFFLFTIFIYFWLHDIACGILVPQPGIELTPTAVEVQSLNHEPLGKPLVLLSHEPGEALHRDAASISSSRGLLHIRVLWTSMQNPIQGVWDGA